MAGGAVAALLLSARLPPGFFFKFHMKRLSVNEQSKSNIESMCCAVNLKAFGTSPMLAISNDMLVDPPE